MQIYFWTKTAHVVFVIAWMATVFYLPRILVNLAEAGDEPSVRARLLLMGRRLYRFGHNMFGMAFLFGLALWQGWRVWPHCLADDVRRRGLAARQARAGRAAARVLHHRRALAQGRREGRALPSAKALRWFNELPVLLLVGVVYLVLAKPF